MELVKPSLKYQESFIEAMKEFQAEEKKTGLDVFDLEQDFGKYIKKFEDHEKGVNLPEGYVPHTRLWLVENGKFVGHVDIRHTLNEELLTHGGLIGYSIRPTERNKGYGTKILAMALPIAKKFGNKRILVTCDDDNLGSIKIIEKSGGVLENKVPFAGKLKRRYWISI